MPTSNGSHFGAFDGTGPMFELVRAIAAIEQDAGLNRLVLLKGAANGYYLYRFGTRMPLVSFGLSNGQIANAIIRYAEPFDPKSKRRLDPETQQPSRFRLSGWEAMGQLLKSAARRSTAWKNIQTIETTVEPGSSDDDYSYEPNPWQWVTYEIWATARHDHTVRREATLYHPAGEATVSHNQQLLLARVTMVRSSDCGMLYEFIRQVELFPELPNWRELPSSKPTDAKSPSSGPVYFDASNEGQVIPPHSEVPLVFTNPL
ncbi:MAG TPA: hypothetical protein VLF91_02770 [Candidatus Saccharimonadales bacterium]|nr:hypothetical protein [Candidatus Saccharimonadales bacterium]